MENRKIKLIEHNMSTNKNQTVRFTVIAEGKEAFNTTSQQKAVENVVVNQKTNNPKIVIHDHKNKSAVQYLKGIHERNYRVSKGFYIEAAPQESELKA